MAQGVDCEWWVGLGWGDYLGLYPGFGRKKYGNAAPHWPSDSEPVEISNPKVAFLVRLYSKM